MDYKLKHFVLKRFKKNEETPRICIQYIFICIHK